MGYKIFYKQSVSKDFKKIDKQTRSRVFNQLTRALSKNPKQGKKLKGPFKGLYSYRVGNYRVVYTFILKGVLVLRVSHRKEVYKKT